MLWKGLLTFSLVCMFIGNVYAEGEVGMEIIPNFEDEESLDMLNEELRRLRTDVNSVTDTDTDTDTNYIESGMIVVWGGAIADISSDWLLCDGSAVSRTTYADLFAAIGTTHGIGDGSTTFNLPNLTDRFVIHADADSGGTRDVGDTGGAHTSDVSHTHTVPNHTHDFATSSKYVTTAGTYRETVENGTDVAAAVGGSNVMRNVIQHYTDTDGTCETDSGGSATQDTLPKYYALAYIIKT